MPPALTPLLLSALLVLVAGSSLLLRPAGPGVPMPGVAMRRRDARRLALRAALPACLAAPTTSWLAPVIMPTPSSAFIVALALLLGAVVSLALPMRATPSTAPQRRLRTVATAAAAMLAAMATVAAGNAADVTVRPATHLGAMLALPSGYALLLPMFTALRERLDTLDAPAPLRGQPLVWLSAALVLLAFAGLVAGVRAA